MFIAGDDDAAKQAVTTILDDFGWEVSDIGGIEGARELEADVHLVGQVRDELGRAGPRVQNAAQVTDVWLIHGLGDAPRVPARRPRGSSIQAIPVDRPDFAGLWRNGAACEGPPRRSRDGRLACGADREPVARPARSARRPLDGRNDQHVGRRAASIDCGGGREHRGTAHVDRRGYQPASESCHRFRALVPPNSAALCGLPRAARLPTMPRVSMRLTRRRSSPARATSWRSRASMAWRRCTRA